MSYVPVYLTAGDDCSGVEAHTSSRRGRVNEVWASVNTHFGEAVKIRVFSEGSINRVSESHCTERIGYWNSKGNKNKVKYWQAKLVEALEHNNEASAKESVQVSADFRFGSMGSKMSVRVNGYSLTQSDMEVLAMLRCEDWEGILRWFESRLPSNIMEDTALLSHVVSKKV